MLNYNDKHFFKNEQSPIEKRIETSLEQWSIQSLIPITFKLKGFLLFLEIKFTDVVTAFSINELYAVKINDSITDDIHYVAETIFFPLVHNLFYHSYAPEVQHIILSIYPGLENSSNNNCLSFEMTKDRWLAQLPIQNCV